MTGFLFWIGTYCISCVVQQRSRIKDLFSLVGYDDSCLAAIRHVESILRVIQPGPNIRSYSVLSKAIDPHFECCNIDRGQDTPSGVSLSISFLSHKSYKLPLVLRCF